MNKLNEYYAEWFDSLDWKYKEGYFISTSEEELKTYFNIVVCKPAFRETPYRGTKEKEDSLTITFNKEITLPYSLQEN